MSNTAKVIIGISALAIGLYMISKIKSGKRGYPSGIIKGTQMAENSVVFGVGDSSHGYWQSTPKGEEWYTYHK